VNALGTLRQRLGYEREDVAARLKISLADLDTLEATPTRLLEISLVAEHVGACECRLDVVAVHIDGESIWLEHQEGS
jgi:hypothetical protein